MKPACACADDVVRCPCCFAMATAAEPRPPCPTCQQPQWCYHDFEAGDEVFYCPDCMRFELTVA